MELKSDGGGGVFDGGGVWKGVIGPPEFGQSGRPPPEARRLGGGPVRVRYWCAGEVKEKGEGKIYEREIFL